MSPHTIKSNPRLTVPQPVAEVGYTLREGRLTLNYEGQSTELDESQSVIWGLLQTPTSTIEHLRFQFADLHPDIERNQAHRLLDAAIEQFARSNLIQLNALEHVEYPVDLTRFTHLFSTRGGLYGVSPKGYQRLAYGMFFGLTTDSANTLFAFEFPHKLSPLWRESFSIAKKSATPYGIIRAFSVSNGRLSPTADFATEVASNTHHLVFNEDGLVGVDTEGQTIYRADAPHNATAVLDPARYYHINSLAKLDTGWLLMKCVNGDGSSQSSVAQLDESFALKRALTIEGERCHDFLIEDGNPDAPAFWYCDSVNNHIRHYPTGTAIKIDENPIKEHSVRGLSETDTHWIVGSGRYGRYYSFTEQPKPLGAISFINKTNTDDRVRFEVPELSCCIIANPWHEPAETL